MLQIIGEKLAGGDSCGRTKTHTLSTPMSGVRVNYMVTKKAYVPHWFLRLRRYLGQLQVASHYLLCDSPSSAAGGEIWLLRSTKGIYYFPIAGGCCERCRLEGQQTKPFRRFMLSCDCGGARAF